MKAAVLRAYELVPEAYRLKFRNIYKDTKVTHMEFLHDMDKALERWLRATYVDNDYKKFRELILMENFCRCINKDVACYLFERQVEDTRRAAVMADEYVLTHSVGQESRILCNAKGTVMTHVKSPHNGYAPPRSQRNLTHSGEPRNLVQRSISKVERGDKTCYYCGKYGHYERDCFKKDKDVKDSKIK